MDRISTLKKNRSWLKRKKGRASAPSSHSFSAFFIDILQAEGVELLKRQPALLIFSVNKQCLVGLGFKGDDQRTIDILWMNVRPENRGSGHFRKAMDLICSVADKHRFKLRANVARYELLNEAVFNREFWFGVGDDANTPDRRTLEHDREADLAWYDALNRNWGFDISGGDFEITREPRIV